MRLKEKNWNIRNTVTINMKTRKKNVKTNKERERSRK